MCPTNDGIEGREHFLLRCPSFDVQRRDLLAGVSLVLRSFVEINCLPNDILVQILFYCDKGLSNEINKNILELILVFIHNTGRFDYRSEIDLKSFFSCFSLFTCLRLFHIGYWEFSVMLVLMKAYSNFNFQ